jgi:hypothetical protein
LRKLRDFLGSKNAKARPNVPGSRYPNIDRTCRVVGPFPASNPSGIARSRMGRCNGPMGGPTRRRIFGDRVGGAKIRAVHARERAKEAARQADAAECLLWSEQMEGFGGPAQPSPKIAQCLNGVYGWLQVKCHRCETRASIPLEHVRRPRDTPIWKLEAALKCRSCRTPRQSPPVHMIKLTMEREIDPYLWVHPDEEQ